MGRKRMSKGRQTGKKHKKRKNTGFWAAIACMSALALAGIVMCVWFLINPTGSRDYNYYINLAQRYASEQRYEDAVKQYWVAINLDETQETAYLELGELYEETQQTYNAMNVYSLGYQRTNSSLLNEKYLSFADQFQEGTPLENQIEKNYTVKLRVNRSLLNCFSSFAMAQYTQTYGSPEVKTLSSASDVQSSGVVAQVRYPKLSAVFYYYNTGENSNVLDASGRPDENQVPAEIMLEDLSQLFSGMEGSISYEELSDPEMGLSSLKKERNNKLQRNVVRFTFAGCLVVIETDSEGTIASASAWNRIYPQSNGSQENTGAGFSGQVLSAVDGKGVANAKLSLLSSESSEPVQEVSSDIDGSYAFEPVPDGDYEVLVSAENYVEDRFQITLDAREDNTDKNFVITPLLGEGEIRFVLSWEATPEDLDAYLKGEASDGSEVFVSYFNQQSYDRDGKIAAELDTDDRDGYGPETITLKDTGGSYEMTVVDYRATGTVSHTEAKVRIYTGNNAPIEVTVPSDVSNFWHVCKVENGQVEVTNYALDDSLLSSGSK